MIYDLVTKKNRDSMGTTFDLKFAILIRMFHRPGAQIHEFYPGLWNDLVGDFQSPTVTLQYYPTSEESAITTDRKVNSR